MLAYQFPVILSVEEPAVMDAPSLSRSVRQGGGFALHFTTRPSKPRRDRTPVMAWSRQF